METPRASRTGMVHARVDRAWVLLAGLAATAVLYLVVPETGLDGEFPEVVRPTFSRYPPAAYRLAEPGDTLDRVGVYLASGALVLAAIAAFKCARFGWSGRARGWIAAVALSLAAFWASANPGPAFDGWHGLNFNVIADLAAPTPVRVAVGLLAAALVGTVAWGGRALLADLAADRGVRRLALVAATLCLVRAFGWPDPEPHGYWPRWAWIVGLTAWAFAVTRRARRHADERAEARGTPDTRRGRLATLATLVTGGLATSAVGLGLVWYHRPIDRLRAVVPGQIYISAIPTPEGLAVAHARHQFKTIINLFPERTPLRSPLFDREVAFARAHGIDLVENPHTDDRSPDFVDRTLRIARDPAAWPVLVHCHACMDRTPAWMGMYRFLFEGRSLADVFREIEQHRGCRPKASVTLLYTQLLPERSGGRFDADPSAPLLRKAAAPGMSAFTAAPPTAPQLGARRVRDVE